MKEQIGLYRAKCNCGCGVTHVGNLIKIPDGFDMWRIGNKRTGGYAIVGLCDDTTANTMCFDGCEVKADTIEQYINDAWQSVYIGPKCSDCAKCEAKIAVLRQEINEDGERMGDLGQKYTVALHALGLACEKLNDDEILQIALLDNFLAQSEQDLKNAESNGF
jgi:hypothetical protein